MENTEERGSCEHSFHDPIHRIPRDCEPSVLDKCQRRARDGITELHLCCARSVLYIRAHVPYQKANSEVDTMLVHDVLCAVHRGAILPSVLHFGARRRRRRPGSGAYVDFESHVLDASW